MRIAVRILLLTHNLAGLGGSFQRAHALGRGLAALGHLVTLAAARREPGLRILRESGDGVEVFACPYLDIAQEHAGVCTMERRMIEQVLGETIALEGTIREGRRSCHFTVVHKS